MHIEFVKMRKKKTKKKNNTTELFFTPVKTPLAQWVFKKIEMMEVSENGSYLQVF